MDNGNQSSGVQNHTVACHLFMVYTCRVCVVPWLSTWLLTTPFLCKDDMMVTCHNPYHGTWYDRCATLLGWTQERYCFEDHAKWAVHLIKYKIKRATIHIYSPHSLDQNDSDWIWSIEHNMVGGEYTVVYFHRFVICSSSGSNVCLSCKLMISTFVFCDGIWFTSCNCYHCTIS